MSKDLFSKQASTYARFRPHYPPELYEFIYSKVRNFDAAWDCGTGNGQVANVLAQQFGQVIATDLSETQLSHAKPAGNIVYKKSGEEIPWIPDHTFDLVTVATAIHWFDFDRFYKEVRRTAKDGAVVAVWCYHLPRVNPAIDALVDAFCFGLLGPYWDKERKWVDDHYKHIPFPFDEIETPAFSIKANWKAEQLEGYINSWSSLQHYLTAKGTSPVPRFMEELLPLWQGALPVEFPLPVRMGTL